ncbi:hypothetical protein BJ912DRAFT_947537 [Pholiota molesta]|nr:hypothetical protein BJ912DRAFT_947537 [Pholiota molesta]
MASTAPTTPDTVPAVRINPVVSFIIGLGIILLASVLNAAGLNLTKLDHVRTSAVPKAARRRDWMRPLWLLGMLLYILSQLIGSTLALEYMRAEYVAPLGSTSLVFNFLFARFLVGTPVTKTDIYGTIIVVLGVIGIVAFGSINSGLTSATDVTHITYLWRRGGWLGYFFTMTFSLISVLIFTYCLDWILAQRAELAAGSFSATRPQGRPSSGLPVPVSLPNRRRSWLGMVLGIFYAIKAGWDMLINFVTDQLELWAAPKDDKQVAWTLGIGWACCGGGLAGGCLVLRKRRDVKLLSGSLSHENPGNQFGHAAPIFTIILLVITAVLQIICLNRGLKVYDSTLVVPVSTEWLDSLIFNDEVGAYKGWTLFLIFVSIGVLIAGVVLLTHKKPEPVTGKIKSTAPRRRKQKKGTKGAPGTETGMEMQREGEVLWAVGEESDEDEDDEGLDDDIDHHQHPIHNKVGSAQILGHHLEEEDDGWVKQGRVVSAVHDERRHRRSMDPFRDVDDDAHELSEVIGRPKR